MVFVFEKYRKHVNKNILDFQNTSTLPYKAPALMLSMTKPWFFQASIERSPKFRLKTIASSTHLSFQTDPWVFLSREPSLCIIWESESSRAVLNTHFRHVWPFPGQKAVSHIFIGWLRTQLAPLYGGHHERVPADIGNDASYLLYTYCFPLYVRICDKVWLSS